MYLQYLYKISLLYCLQVHKHVDLFSIFSHDTYSIKDFLIKLGIKPLMHLLEISIFSLNNDIATLTKIMNNPAKDFKTLSFKVIFQCLKLVESFQKNFSVKTI